MADFGQQPSSGKTGAHVDDLPAESAENYITASSLEDGSSYGRLGCYILQLAFTPEMITDGTYWRATFVLQPSNGTFVTNLKTPVTLAAMTTASRSTSFITPNLTFSLVDPLFTVG